jgi:hypothetical protein
MFDAAMPTGGRPRQLSSRTVLLGIMIALDSGRPAHLAAAHRALSSIEASADGKFAAASYRQIEDTFSLMCRSVDPSPVPSFKGVEDAGRAEHLRAARTGIEVDSKRAALLKLADALLEASVPEAYKSASTSLAVDWTDHETWSRPRAKYDPQPANDPDASWGHAKRNAPGAKDFVFFGYYAQVATMVPDEGGRCVPELVRRVAVEAPRLDPARVMAESLARMAADGISLGDVCCDCGYSNRHPATWSRPLRAAGGSLVMDLHPNDRGQRGTFEGAICANGQLYCPATPSSLLGLGPLRRGATEEEVNLHAKRCTELGSYKLSRLSGPDADGYERVSCPAAAGKLRCPLKAASLALSANHPSVLEPPAGELGRCCAQLSITVPPQVNEKTRQKHDYPSALYADSYARRTAAERTYASLSDPSTGGIRRGWCRLFGLAKNTIMYALGVVVRNVRIVESFERARAEEARRAAIGLPAKRRRRRRHPIPEDPSPKAPPAPPG